LQISTNDNIILKKGQFKLLVEPTSSTKRYSILFGKKTRF